MSLVAGAWMLHGSLIDGSGRIVTFSRRLVAADAAAAAAAATAHINLLTAVTDCKVVGYSVGQTYEENALGALPAVTVTNSNQAVLSASILDQPNKFATLQIPGAKIDVFVAATGHNANIVDVTKSIVTDYLADFTAAGHVFISDGEHLDPVYNARGERVTKYRRLG
jgi:hypothetical protein